MTELIVHTTASGVALTHPHGASTDLTWRWLRDHGEDPASLDPITRQRRVDALGSAPRPATHAAIVDNGTRLALEWPDAPTHTWISTETLSSLTAAPREPARRAWSRADSLDLTIVEVDAVLRDDVALASWLGDIVRYGVGRLRGFDGTHRQAEQLARRIGYPRATIFGTLWDLASDIDTHDDTAYSQSFLAPHTDGTYAHDAPGLQMFCCTSRTGTGGESIVVDGLAIADELRDTHPALHTTLTSVEVPAHYIEPGIELRASRPAIRRDGVTGHFRQLSLNNYDRSPLLLPPDEMQRFYEAYARLQQLAADESRWFSVRLEAGDVLVNDNWRVLHGRQAYTGERHFIGCYINHEDFESRCRVLNVAGGAF